MPMTYSYRGISDAEIPRAALPLLQHALDTYASETNKVGGVWSCFSDDDLGFRPHAKSSTVGEIVRHQLLSERRFFGEFLGSIEPAADRVVPAPLSVKACVDRQRELAVARLDFLASRDANWWTTTGPFFDLTRES